MPLFAQDARRNADRDKGREGARIAYVEVADFSLTALLRASPELAGLPVAISQGAGTHATVYQASPEARAGGVLPGLGIARARQRFPELKALPPSPDAERGAQATLLQLAFAFSPQVSEAGRGALYLDWSGMSGLYDSDGAIATALDAALARVGLPCRIGVASNKTVARVAARALQCFAGADVMSGEGSVAVVPTSDEAVFLEPLPIAVLEPSPELAARLEAWGIRRLGQLARLSERGVTRRLGAEGVALRLLAQGHDDLPFANAVPPRSYEETVSFDDWTIDNLEPLLNVLAELTDRLLERLTLGGLAAQGLVATLSLDPRGHDVRHVAFAAPLKDRRAILELLRHDLATLSPRAPIAGVRVVALPAAPQAVQGNLFAPDEPTPERLAVTLARLHALVGEGRAGAPTRPARRNPGATALAPFAALRRPNPELAGVRDRGGGKAGRYRDGLDASSVRDGSRAGKPRPVLAVAVLRPPRVIGVELTGDRPAVVHVDGRRHAIRRAAGPWRLSEGWWTAEPTCRDDFDVELDDDRLLRIYRDLRTGSWLWDGVYG
jgi:protein ImuB